MDCPFSSDGKEHPFFVYLASDKRYTNNKHWQTIVPYIGVSINPFQDIRRQNRMPGYTGADHTTKEGAGSLQIELVIGAFTREVAHQFRDEWRKSSRKLVSRVQKGIQQAKRYKADGIYCLSVPWARRQIEALKLEHRDVKCIQIRHASRLRKKALV